MKRWYLFLFMLFPLNLLPAQSFSLELEEVNLPGLPGMQSYVAGHVEGNVWIVLGGRTDGLHQRQPFAAFLPDGLNTLAWRMDLDQMQAQSVDLSVLPAATFEQLQSTNMEFVQRDSFLYVMGGYGYSATAANHITHDGLIAVNLPALSRAIVQGSSPVTAFRRLQDARVQVTGGQAAWLGDRVYLCGGQHFAGRYNPMGPNMGPGFFQQYTNAIRTFRIQDDGNTLSLTDYAETVDTLNLHRRDYNMLPQRYPDGHTGLVMFSGVFRYGFDLPWLNSVEVDTAGHRLIPNFNQYLNHYHCAKLPIWEGSTARMHSVFFGGISRYYWDSLSQSVTDDQSVPFVRTVTRVTREADGTWTEYRMPLQMPAYLGSGAEFLPAAGAPFDADGILLLDQVGTGRQCIGYLWGGIESSAANIFFVNDGSQSVATPRLFRVCLTRSSVSRDEAVMQTSHLVIRANPNPFRNRITVFWTTPAPGAHLELFDMQGRLLNSWILPAVADGSMELNLREYPAGQYLIVLNDGIARKSKLVVKED